MDKIQITQFTPENATEWDAFIESSNNGTLFNQRTFLNYHPADRFIDKSLLFYKDGRLLAILPAALRPTDEQKILRSHAGASYGGIIVRPDTSLRDTERVIKSLLTYSKKAGFGGIELTVPPLVYLRRPSNYYEFLLYQHGFRYRKRELTAVCKLHHDAEFALNQFTAESRRAVRRAIKLGVEVKWSEDYATFYEILASNLQLRHGVTPTHSLKELLWLADHFPEKIHLLASFSAGQMCAGTVFFEACPRTTLAFYISHNPEFQKLRPLNILFYEAFQHYAAKGFEYFDFGTFTNNMEVNWGLSRFKEGYGTQGIFRDTLLRVFDE
ncbi:MAG: GNAT family N-acetyltransferase [Calditrichaeota bacterium]|nr:MAG: GNAT family N-acetyltransferase [Calditrichota bacterium]